MAIPRKYRRSSEQVIASYNYFDVNEGTGIIEYMGMAVTTNNSPVTYEYILTTNQNAKSARDGLAALRTFSETFKVSFNRPKIIKGIAYFSAPIWLYAQSGTNTGFFSATLKHYNALTTAETTIGATIQVEGYTGGSTTPYTLHYPTLKWDLSLLKVARNDELRLTVVGGGSGGSGSVESQIGFSPIGTQAVATNSVYAGSGRMSLFLPFIITD